MDILELLLMAGADINHSNGADPNVGNGIALITAVERNKYDLIKLLLKYGAHARLIEESELRQISKKGYNDIYDILIENYE